MKVGDLYYSLGIRPDGRSFAAARQQAKRLGQLVENDERRRGAGLLRQIGRFKLGGVTAGVTGAAIAAGAAFGAAYKDAINFDDALTRLNISSNGAMGSMVQVREQLLKVSSETGVAKEELAGGAASFVALTGDGKAASLALGTFAKVQKATGAEMQDITSAAAALTQQLGIGAVQYEDAFSILVAGGKAGKIELKDMASLTASLGANFKQFGGSQGLGGLATLGGAFQIAARNFGSASEAATGLESLMGSIIQHSGKLKEAGVNVFESDGQTLKSLESIVDAITDKGFNPTQLIDLLGRKEAYKTLQALRDNRQEWSKIARETRNAKDVAVDYDKYNQSSSAQLKKAWNDIKVAIAGALTPERVQAFTLFLKDAVSVAARLANTLSSVPGYVDFLGGGGKVARQREDDALDNLLLKGRSLDDVERQLTQARNASPLDFGATRARNQLMAQAGTADLNAIQAAVVRRRAANENVVQRDLEQYGFSPGVSETRRLDVEASRFMDRPTIMEADAAAGTFAPITNVTVNAQTGADANEIARVARDQVNQALATEARKLSSHLGN